MENKLALTPVRLGRIGYINTLPFYHGLFRSGAGVKVIEGSPAEINGLMSRGEIDIAAVSSLEYALRQDDYYVLPDLCIGARDFSRSVLLLSRDRIEGLNKETIILTNKSLSSQTLLKILFRYKYRFDNNFVVSPEHPDKMLRMGKAALLIGDEALFYKPKGFVYKYDLSELWWDWKGLPFCFSLWVVRKDFYERCPQVVHDFYRILKNNAEKNLQDLECLMKESIGLSLADDRFSSVFGYLFNLAFFIDEAMLNGLKAFYQMAERARYAPKVEQIEFIKP